MPGHSETNPHFGPPPTPEQQREGRPSFTPLTPEQQREGRPSLTPPPTGGPLHRQRSDQQSQLQERQSQRKEQRGKEKASQQPFFSPWWPLRPREGQTSQQPQPQVQQPKHGQYHSPWEPPHPHGQDGPGLGPVATQPQSQPALQLQPQRGKKKDSGLDVTKPEPAQGQGPRPGHEQGVLDRGPVATQRKPRIELQPRLPPQLTKEDHPPQVAPPQSLEPQQQVTEGPGVSQSHPSHDRQSGQPDLWAPPTNDSTDPLTWFGGVFCAIFSIIIFLGGLLVLIIYLVYRPRSPRFDIADVTLNAAYIDEGSLLNADLSIYANFTNPNKKLGVYFRGSIVDLYYGHTLIATQYIKPFSIPKAKSAFGFVHLTTSQVKLTPNEIQLLQEQIASNAVIFKVRGLFRVRSYLASFLKYSYRLHGQCSFMVTAPPTGVLRAVRCKSKR